jgi:hypothetical protein
MHQTMKLIRNKQEASQAILANGDPLSRARRGLRLNGMRRVPTLWAVTLHLD